MQKARVGAAAVQVCHRILRLECACGVNVRIEKWVDVNSPTVGVLRPSAVSRDVSAAERRRVVVFHLELIGSGRILVNRPDLLDGIPRLVSCSKIVMTCDASSSCTINWPRCVWPSKPMWSTPTRRSCSGPTGQPGRQLAPSSAAVTGSMAGGSAGAGGALAGGEAAGGGGGPAAGGGGATVHCTSTTLAAVITASAATLRLTNVDR